VGTRENNQAGTSLFVKHRRTWHEEAFTLVELLVVMSLMTLLTSILLLALQQAGRCARAAACRGQLGQWGLAFSLFLDDQDPAVLVTSYEKWDSLWRPYCDSRRSLFLCPMATRYERNLNDPVWPVREAIGSGIGSKFTAWKLATRTPTTLEPGLLLGSYGVNGSGLAFLDARVSGGRGFERPHIPIFLDCVSLHSSANATDEPPAYDGALASPGDLKSWCIDRHHGATNGLFLDWSVRGVGLKELWMLDWSPWFDTRNAWTRAGGVQPEDWPRWMRKFKDD
jgi:type II secretory pathway pseudopilin PulG